MRVTLRLLVTVLAMLILTACDMPRLPSEPADLSLPEMPDMLRDLGLPDLTQLPNLPGLEDLPDLNVGPNAVAFAGPTERSIAVGETIPGTDIQLASVSGDSAEFLINGLRASRSGGDSLDYEGSWRGANGITYSLRLRIYNIGSSSVRAAGVQRLVVENIQPVEQQVNLTGMTVNVPFVASVNSGQTIKGLTYGYAQSTERGAEISGLAADVYPYRKLGDSIQWEGFLRQDIPIEYNLRVLLYNNSNLQVGGVATLQIPTQ